MLLLTASNLCMQEKSVFTQEVLAVVIQQLLEQVPIPVLFMKIVRPKISLSTVVGIVIQF